MPAGLTKDSIVRTALSLLDEVGMDGLTLRALAARLGVQAPALYWHVRNKQALLDEMATVVWRRIGDVMAGLPPGTPWRAVMTTYAVTVRGELLGHRDGAKAFSGTTLTDPGVVRRQEPVFANLTGQGFTLEGAARSLTLVHYFTIGFCVEEQGAVDPGRRAELVGADAAPLTVEAGPEIFGDPDARFTRLTDMLLAAITPDRAP
jgi:TetR/AcrR family transcriptional regulator, tetracycline repressor protein